MVRVEECESDLYAAVDLVADKLKRKLNKVGWLGKQACGMVVAVGGGSWLVAGEGRQAQEQAEQSGCLCSLRTRKACWLVGWLPGWLVGYLPSCLEWVRSGERWGLLGFSGRLPKCMPSSQVQCAHLPAPAHPTCAHVPPCFVPLQVKERAVQKANWPGRGGPKGGDTIEAHLDTTDVVDKLPTDQLAPPVPEVVR